MVEWGSERRLSLDRLTAFRGWHPAIPWLLGGLGVVAWFGSLVGEWQLIVRARTTLLSQSGITELDQLPIDSAGLGSLPVWGMGWLFGGTLLVICGCLAVAGKPPLREPARAIGLAVAVTNLGLLAATGLNLTQTSPYDGVYAGLDYRLGRGVYAAFASVVLLGAAIYLSRFQSRPAPRLAAKPVVDGPADLTVGPADLTVGPADLTVGPAEPMVHPTDTLQG